MRNKSIKIKIPEVVQMLLDRLNRNGKDNAFVVGGCVRDSLLRREPNDWDISTKLTPIEAKAVLADLNPFDKGIEFGTIAVNINGEDYEITTFRKEAGTKDCRHPEEVIFADSIEEDLLRRDFTINAMAYNRHIGLVYVGSGLKDLKAEIIRAVGNPKERFSEDALRMLRAIRLSAQLGFWIERDTFNAIKTNAELIRFVSQERLNKEFSKTLLSDNPEKVELFVATGLAKIIAPELDIIFDEAKARQKNPNHLRGKRPTTVGEHTIDALKACARLYHSRNVPKRERLVYGDLTLRMAILVHDFGKPHVRKTFQHSAFGEMDTFPYHPAKSAEIAEEFLKRTRFSSAFIRDVLLLVEHHDTPFERTRIVENKPRTIIDFVGMRQVYAGLGGTKKEFLFKADELMEKLFALKVCDAYGKNPKAVFRSSRTPRERVDAIRKTKKLFYSKPEEFSIVVPTNGNAIKSVLNLTDKDMKMYGRSIGEVIERFQEKILINPGFGDNLTDKEMLRREVIDLVQHHKINLPIPA